MLYYLKLALSDTLRSYWPPLSYSYVNVNVTITIVCTHTASYCFTSEHSCYCPLLLCSF